MGEMVGTMSQWIREGKIKMRETVVEGFEKLPQALNMLFHGANSGKLVVKV
jgi:NADPH-dependent curcumin reductase CurA